MKILDFVNNGSETLGTPNFNDLILSRIFNRCLFNTTFTLRHLFSHLFFSCRLFIRHRYQPTANMNGGHRRRRSSQKSQSYLYLDGEGRELNTSSLDRTEKSLVPIKDLMEK